MGFFLIKKKKEKKEREIGFYIYWDQRSKKEEKKKIIETIISMVWKQELHNIVHFSLIFIGKEMDGQGFISVSNC